MTVATVASVRDQIRETARLFDPHGSPLITLEGGENGSVQKGMRKQSAAQQVPAQLNSFQPEPKREATCTERPKEPVSGKVSGTPTTKTQESITLEGREQVTKKTRCTTASEPRDKMRRLKECGQGPRRMRLGGAEEVGKWPEWQRR